MKTNQNKNDVNNLEIDNSYRQLKVKMIEKNFKEKCEINKCYFMINA